MIVKQSYTVRDRLVLSVIVIAVAWNSCPAGALLIDGFHYPNREHLVSTWRPGPGAVTPSTADQGSRDGVALTCSFLDGSDRFYWDRELALDLSDYDSFMLNLTCHDPEAMRSLTVYFKSGNGWYTWNHGLQRAGYQPLILQKKDFVAEGPVAGWQGIDGVRIAFWKGASHACKVILHRFDALQAKVFLIQADRLVADAGQRALARRTTDLMSRWLADMHIQHAAIRDRDLDFAQLARADVIILPYNPELDQTLRSMIERLLARGCRLLVFYSQDRELARMMGLRLGPYTLAEKFNPWTSMYIPEAEKLYMPDRVFQFCGNILPVQPDHEQARVVAWWTRSGQRTLRYPACVLTPGGGWVTYIMKDGDVLYKKFLLAALLSHCQPAFWPEMARFALEQSQHIATYDSYGDAVLSMEQAAGRRNDVRSGLKQAEELYRQALRAFRKKNYGQTLRLAMALREQLVTCHAMLQDPVNLSRLGIWDHRGAGWIPGRWDMSCRILKGNGIDMLFPNILSDGYCHHASRLVPRSKTFEQWGDQLAQCIAAAHRYKIEVHVWKVCWKVERAPAAFLAKLKAQGRLQVTDSGVTQPWLSPSHPANRTHAIDSLKEIVRGYEVDGVHLDYIRYPDQHTDYSPHARQSFERALGRPVDDWPEDVRPSGRLWSSYNQWRVHQINNFVAEVHGELKAIKPNLVLSVAVFGGYPNCVETVAQDWKTWLDRGYVDYICPMNYTEDPTRYTALLADQTALAGHPDRILSGIGVSSIHSSLTADKVIEQLHITRRMKAGGAILFDLDEEIRHRVLPRLRMGATRE